jgi:hypothetical protein
LLASAGEVGDRYFLGWPLAAPFRVRQRVAGMIRGVRRGVELMQRVDEEAVVAQDLDPLAVTGVELYPAPQSNQAACLALRVEQFAEGRSVRSGGAHGGQDGGGVKHQPPAGPQQPGGLGYPAGRIAPQAGAAFGDGQVEAARGQRDICGVSLDEREGDGEPVLAAPGGLKLGRVTSTPAGRAPRRASQAEKYAVPQPSSTASRPRTSPGTPSCCPGTLKMPQVMSAAARARTACSSAYSLFARVHSFRLAATSSAPAPVSAIPHHHVSRRYAYATIKGGIRQEHHAG